MTLIIITHSLVFATMQNPPTNIPAPLPLFFSPPPHSAGEVTVLPAPPPPPPQPFVGAPSSVFQITVLPAPPPPPFDGGSSSVDLSPLEFLLALVAIVTIPALIYTFIFAFGCRSPSRRERSGGETSVELSIASEHPHHNDVESSGAIEVSTGVKYQKEAHAKEIGGECPVCLSAFADGEEIRQLSVCKHSFHASCIDLWLSDHSNCPICRATIAAVKRSGDLQQGHSDAPAPV